MIKNESIICFSSKDWTNYSKTSKEFLMEILSRKNKVLYVETTGSRSIELSARDFCRIFKRIKRFFKSSLYKPEGLPSDQELFIFSPLTIPTFNLPGIHKINEWIMKIALRGMMKKLGFREPILWFYLPTFHGLIGHMDEKMSIYHVVDKWSTYPGKRGASFKHAEEELFKKANLFFVSSPLYAEELRKKYRRVHFLPHGVNVEDFLKIHDQVGQCEEKNLPGIPEPWIAMVGGVSEWIDWDLLIGVAKKHPQWSILILGDQGQDADLTRVRAFKNIHLIGRVPYPMLKRFYEKIKVCVVSFKLTEHIRYCFPTRFFEHLANGKPVVSTDFPVARYFEPWIKIAKTVEDFESMIAEALAENSNELIQSRKEFALKNSWNDRVETISDVIQYRLLKFNQKVS